MNLIESFLDAALNHIKKLHARDLSRAAVKTARTGDMIHLDIYLEEVATLQSRFSHPILRNINTIKMTAATQALRDMIAANYGSGVTAPVKALDTLIRLGANLNKNVRGADNFAGLVSANPDNPFVAAVAVAAEHGRHEYLDYMLDKGIWLPNIREVKKAMDPDAVRYPRVHAILAEIVSRDRTFHYIPATA